MKKFGLRFAIPILIWVAVPVLPLFVCAQTPIGCGQTLSGTISAAGERDQYSFTASAGSGITIRTRKTSGTVTPYLELYGPGGALITSAAGKIDGILTETGTYRIDVRDQSNAFTGEYLLYWEKMNDPCNVASFLDCSQVVSGSIGTGVDPPPWKVHTFEASVNDVVTIRAAKTSGANFSPYLELYNPSGSYVVGGISQIDRTLTVTGTYKLLVRDSYNVYSGNYALTWLRLVNPCSSTPLNCGQVLSGSITRADESDMYTFAGSANDVVTIRPRKISGSFTPYLELYSPSGSRIAASAIEIRMTLPASGTYVVLVMDYYYYLYTGDYLLYLEKLNNPSNVTATLSCEQVVSGSIGTFVDPPPWKIYRFTVSANESVTIRTRRTSGTSFSPQMELYNPSGTYLVAGSEINTTLAVAGTYTIIVRDANNAYAGNFSLSWRRVVNPCTSTPLNCGRVLSGSISASDEIDTYTFTGLVNDVVNIRILNSSGGAFYPILDLYGPTGSWVTGGGTAIARRLTASGTYAVLVRDNSNVYTGNYILALVRMSDSCGVTALGCSEVVSGSIGTGIDPPPWRHYNLMASANDVVTIRMTKTSGNISPQIELYNPGGAFIAGGSGQIDRTLTAAGTYTIVARDYNNSSGTYILTWLRVKNPHNARAISCGQVLQGTLSNPGETDAYTFTAAAGDNVALTMTRTSGGLDPSLELYNSSGTRIAYQSTCSGNQIAINQVLSAGTYTVLAYDCANDEVGNYTLKFQRNNNSCPEVTVIAPNGGEAIPAWSIITIRWSSIDLQGISSQEIRLSTDGGQTFPTVIASGLQGSVQTYDWSIPGYLATRQGRIRVTVTDTSGISTPDDSDGNFSIHGAARQYVYDELNRLRQVIYEDGRTITFTYDAAGNRITLRNER